MPHCVTLPRIKVPALALRPPAAKRLSRSFRYAKSRLFASSFGVGVVALSRGKGGYSKAAGDTGLSEHESVYRYVA